MLNEIADILGTKSAMQEGMRVSCNGAAMFFAEFEKTPQ